MNNNLLPRIGTFFILIGCGLLIIFAGSIFAREFNLLYLLFAVATLVLGSGLRRMAPRPEPTRFSTFRKVRQRSRHHDEEKQTQKDQKK